MGSADRPPLTPLAAGAALLVLVSASPGVRPAAAHTTSTGLATFTVDGAALSYRLTLVLSEFPGDVGRQFAAAAAGDPAAVEVVAAVLRGKVSARVGGGACHPGRVRIQGSRVGDSRVVLGLALRCPAAPGALTLRDDWPDLLGEHHRTLVRIEGLGAARDVAFSAERREVTLEGERGGTRHAGGFVVLGVEHILAGYDHLLFLAALLLGGGGAPGLLKVITAFTVAHSVSLAAALLGLVSVPERLVEAVIAASIAWIALENVILRTAPWRRWPVTFAFGLVHGLGFASALGPLALGGTALAGALVGFNLGVEVGQAAVIAAVLPVLVVLRRLGVERRLSLALSCALVVAGVAWCVQRLFFA